MRNLTLMTDLYQLTMMNGYFKTENKNTSAVFDLFFRGSSEITYAIASGLEQVIDYIQNIKFTKKDINYLKTLNLFDDNFLQYLQEFKFSGDIWSVVEGEVVFPNEPILTVSAPLIEAQFIETTILNLINHQTLIATKTAKVVESAKPQSVVEFGLRRAQGPDAGIYGARASYIAGASGTSNVLSGMEFGIAVKGTHSHSWVLSFPSELEAFEKFAECYPNSCLLLVDTYDTLKSGVPNAIKVFNGLKAKGITPAGIRIDSGDLAYLSKQARKMLDNAGFSDVKIFVSNDIDENLIEQLKLQGACIDVYCVGTKLITSYDMPSLGGVYKLAQKTVNGKTEDVMKFSDTIEKMTNPGSKALYRVYDKTNGMAYADIIALEGEKFAKPLVLTHSLERWKKTKLTDYEIRPLLKKIFENGKCVYKIPSLTESANHCKNELSKFWKEYKRLSRPHIYKVNLSDGLYNLKQELINKKGDN